MFEKQAREIFEETVFFIEDRKIKFGIELNDDEYIGRLCEICDRKARKEKSRLVYVEIRKLLMDYIKKHTPYKEDQTDIIEHYINIARKKENRRIAKEIIESTDLNDLDLLSENIEKLQEAQGIIGGAEELEIYDVIEVLDDNLKNGVIQNGVMLDMTDIDNALGGFRPGELLTLAARPGTGKTNCLIEFTKRISKKHKVGIFSAEMSRKLITNRLLSSVTGINSIKLARTNGEKFDGLTGQEKAIVWDKATVLGQRGIKINDVPNIDIDSLVYTARKFKKDFGIEIILVDYLQLLSCKHGNTRREQVCYITKALKGLARELEIPVITLAQLNREADGNIPKLRDLKESGSIEEDSDVVIFLHQTGIIENKTYLSNVQFIIAKNRNGMIDTINVVHDKRIHRLQEAKEYWR